MAVETTLRTQPRLDFKWLKIDLQTALHSLDGLASLWNGLIQDGELTGSFTDGLLNSSGVTARKGDSGKYYCGLRVIRNTNGIINTGYATLHIYMIIQYRSFIMFICHILHQHVMCITT